jgi:probable F420-dependent oxidoreductase
MSTKVGVILNGLPLDLLRAYSKSADERGFDSIWFPEITFNDAFTPTTLAAIETRRARLGTGVVGPWSRSPMVMALTAATLGTLSNGRMILGLGSQARPYVTEWHGRTYERPLRAMREYITILKRVLAGELVTFEGEIFRIRNFQLTFPPPQTVPIYMAAIGPQMIELAGEIADGITGAFWSVEYVRDVVMPRLRAGASKSGRSLDGFAVTLNLPALVTRDEAAFDQHKGMVMQFATAQQSSTFYSESISAAGFGQELELLQAAVERQDFAAAFAAISPQMVDALTLTGSADHVRARVADYAAVGIDSVLAMPSQPGMYYPFYEGHMQGAPFPAFDFPAFLGSVDNLIEGLGD